MLAWQRMVHKLLLRLHRLREHGLRALRSWFYSRVFGNCGEDLRVYGRIKVQNPERVSVGKGCTFNEGCVLIARARITIGSHTHVSPGVVLTSGGLYKDADPGGERSHFSREIHVGSGVWLGSGALVLPGVTIGDGAIVGAGAVVTRNVPERTVAVGIPARVQSRLTPQK